MSITREQVADLREGDVVELHSPHYANVSIRGPLHAEGRDLNLAGYPVRCHSGEPGLPDWTLTVVSRAPRPLYVNHPRTEPVSGDVVRDADSDEHRIWIRRFGGGDREWIGPAGDYLRSALPARLRLLVDGETGMPVVPDLAEAWGDGFEAGSTWTSMNPGPAGGHTDPPLNPYETGQVVP